MVLNYLKIEQILLKNLRYKQNILPRKYKKKSYIGLHGICCATYPEYLRKGSLLGKNVGDIANIKVPNGIISFEIEKIESV